MYDFFFFMSEKLTINGEAMNASLEGLLAVEQFLNDRYLFRRNVLSGKAEFADKPAEGKEPTFRPLTVEALNSIVLKAKRKDVCDGKSPKPDIQEYINSEEVPTYDPINDYLNRLPQWDGQNHVANLFSRIPGISSEQLAYLCVWMRSVVAHWMQMDELHANECVPTLIGPQGCGKTTFLRRLLPKQLRQYYLDHLNLSNKFDKEMALTNNLLVNLDELEAIRPSQHAALKQLLSKNKVNGRKIYADSQDDRTRYASFTATTNNRHPLTDATGSRRYLCVAIPDGQVIDNSGTIDYDQLYAQLVYEVKEQQAPYWFNNDEVARIQELNQEFMGEQDMAKIVKACFRKPKEGEKVKSFNCTQLLEVILNEFPTMVVNKSTRIYLGRAMSELGFEKTDHGHITFYKAVPRKAS